MLWSRLRLPDFQLLTPLHGCHLRFRLASVVEWFRIDHLDVLIRQIVHDHVVVGARWCRYERGIREK